MDFQPKLELDHPPMVTINDNMTIQAMVAQLRVTNIWEDYDKFEEILLSREERANQEIEQLKEMIEMEKLAKVHALEEFKKREELCVKGKKIKEAYETLLKNVKTTKFAERETIEKMRKNNAELESELRKLKNKCVEIRDLRKKNGELESELLGFRKLKEKLIEVSNNNAEIRKLNGELEREISELRKVNEKCVEVSGDNTELRRKNGELETQVCELRKLKGKLVDENTHLRIMIRVWEGERDTLAALVRKDGELEEEVKRNVATIDELRKENRKLEDEKCKYEKMVESLNRKFEDDTKRLMSVDVNGGGNNVEELFADKGVTLNEKDEGDVQDTELGNDKVKVSLQRNGDISHSLAAAAGTAHPLSKENKDAKGLSLERRWVSWHPEEGTAMVLNVDGCSLGNPGPSGFGGVLRRPDGSWIYGFAGNIGISTVLHVELLAIFHGLQAAWEKGYRDIICYSDSALATQLMHAPVNSWHRFAPIIRNIQNLVHRHWRIQIVHTLREANSSADFMAKLGASSSGVWLEFLEPPDGISHLLQADALRVQFARG